MTIPHSKTERLKTSSDNQTTVEFEVLQGEEFLAKDNTEIGRFRMDGIPPKPKGE